MIHRCEWRDRRKTGCVRRKGIRGFTIIELLVAVSVGAALGILAVQYAGGGQGAALNLAQAQLMNLSAAARLRATASGEPVRLLFHEDPGSPLAAARYLRMVVLEQWRDGAWQTVKTSILPGRVHVLPHRSRMPPGLLGGGTEWIDAGGSRLHSSCLFRPVVPRQVDATVAESWAEIVISGHGTTATSGTLVIAPGRPRPDAKDGETPVILENAAAVLGLQMSVYGIAVPVAGREGF